MHHSGSESVQALMVDYHQSGLIRAPQPLLATGSGVQSSAVFVVAVDLDSQGSGASTALSFFRLGFPQTAGAWHRGGVAG